jgi:hypothetical protein
MTQGFVNMIYLFSCGAMGISSDLDHDIDIDEVFKQAEAQGVWHIVFLAINKLYTDGEIKIEYDIFNKLKNQTIAAVAVNTRRMNLIHDVIKKLEAAGARPCVLKGEVLSLLYQNPDCRISGDTDILIDIKSKDNAAKVLAELGFDIKPLNPTSHHMVATHPVAGMVELHLRLYDELFEDVWFDNKILNEEERRSVKADDGSEFVTLGITDGLVFVSLHYIKHFLSGGVGIRQLMDVLLYMKEYFREIDWKRFNHLMEYLKYQKFINNSIGIGVKYLNFKQEDLPPFTCDKDIMDKILSDIELGGVFGKNEKGRSSFYLQYTMERYNRFKGEDYSRYIKKWWLPNLIRIIFPHIKVLALKYPYVKKSGLLYIVAWFHRMGKFIIASVKSRKPVYRYINIKKNYDEDAVIKKRMKLVRELDMI